MNYKSYLESTLKPIENIIFLNEKKFIKNFCKGNVMDLLGIYFSSESIQINYVLMSGQHIGDSIKIEEFDKWMIEVLK